MGIEGDVDAVPAIEYFGVVVALLGFEGKPYDERQGGPEIVKGEGFPYPIVFVAPARQVAEGGLDLVVSEGLVHGKNWV